MDKLFLWAAKYSIQFRWWDRGGDVSGGCEMTNNLGGSGICLGKMKNGKVLS